ncbi:P7 [Sclerotinia sclerotiorum mycoreovirus 4]|uniref:P7 n=1 Tax=Sclerotinia sclerotiorum mycoreovirus 4 TaxID=1840528 RepID=UPI0007C1BA66|nr:P7 [Sclerotinia sclerotiorum mycoreovirus 4]ANC52165.1 P7 [Sclerotinia sclerotiorum mycoreovirus 4]
MAQQVHAVRLSPQLRSDILTQIANRSPMTLDTGTILQQVELPLNRFLMGVCFVGDGDVPYLLIRQMAGYTWHIDQAYGIDLYEVDVGEEMAVLEERVESLAYVMTVDERDYLYPVITVDEGGRVLNINYTDDPYARQDVDTYARLSRDLQLIRDDISVSSHERRPVSPSVASRAPSRPRSPTRSEAHDSFDDDDDLESEAGSNEDFVRISYASLRKRFRPPAVASTLVRSMLYNPTPIRPPPLLETSWSTFYTMRADLRRKIRYSLNFHVSHKEWPLSIGKDRTVGLIPRPNGGVYHYISHMCNDPESRLLQLTEWEHMVYMIDMRYVDLEGVCANGLRSAPLKPADGKTLEVAKDILYLFGRATVTFREWKRETVDENELLARIFPDRTITVTDYSYLNTFKHKVDQRENVRMVLGLIDGLIYGHNHMEVISALVLMYMVANKQLPGTPDVDVDNIHVKLESPQSGLAYLILLAFIVVVADR